MSHYALGGSGWAEAERLFREHERYVSSLEKLSWPKAWPKVCWICRNTATHGHGRCEKCGGPYSIARGDCCRYGEACNGPV